MEGVGDRWGQVGAGDRNLGMKGAGRPLRSWRKGGMEAGLPWWDPGKLVKIATLHTGIQHKKQKEAGATKGRQS